MTASLCGHVAAWADSSYRQNNPDSKVYGANMRSIWGRQDPGGPHIGPMNFAIWEAAWLWA